MRQRQTACALSVLFYSDIVCDTLCIAMKKKIIVKRAAVLGYCFGVKNAVDTSLKTARLYPHKRVYTFGPLIHNPATLESLAQRGVRAINPDAPVKPEVCHAAPVIIRAHGISPQKRDELEKSGAQIIDATCPRVRKNQRQAAAYAEKGHTVILAGDKNHGELVGIAGFVNAVGKNPCIIVQNVCDAQAVCLAPAAAPVLMAQTTIKHSEYAAISDALKKKYPHVIVVNSICSATEQRQQALVELAETVEAILVVGGKASANTRRLLQTALDLLKPAWLVENKNDLPEEIFTFSSVGITAGASTPEFIIREIEETLNAPGMS